MYVDTESIMDFNELISIIFDTIKGKTEKKARRISDNKKISKALPRLILTISLLKDLISLSVIISPERIIDKHTEFYSC